MVKFWVKAQENQNHTRPKLKNTNYRGFAGGTVVESACRCRGHGFEPWSVWEDSHMPRSN